MIKATGEDGVQILTMVQKDMAGRRVAQGLEEVSIFAHTKERRPQRMFKLQDNSSYTTCR